MADGTVNRRRFLSGAATAQGGEGPESVPSDRHPVSLSVNGRPHHLVIDPRRTLLDLLRDVLALTGAKKGCDHGQCGACTVRIGGKQLCHATGVRVRKLPLRLDALLA